MKKFSLVVIILLICQFSFSKNQVDTISVYSYKMKKTVSNVVILPEGYSDKKKYPVVYLLHGFQR